MAYPEQYQSQLGRTERRRKLMEQLLGQATSPLEQQQVSGRVVPLSPLQGLSKVAQAMLARKGITAADKEEEAIKQQFGAKRQEATDEVKNLMMGRPETPYQLSPEEQFGSEQIPGLRNAAIEADPTKAAITAATSPYLQGSGISDVATAMMRAQAQPRGDYNVIKDVTVDGRTVPVIFNTRTRETYNMDGTPFTEGVPELGPTSPNFDPTVKKSTSKAGEEGKLEAQLALEPEIRRQVKQAESEQKREFNMQGLNESLDRAEKLLTGEITPTESFAGVAADFLGRTVGFSPEGANEAAQLKAIGGALTAKMPRMEGPQSDRDTQLYREMAAQIGDPTVTQEQRLAALQTVREIWGKYERLNQGDGTGTNVPENTDEIINEADAILGL